MEKNFKELLSSIMVSSYFCSGEINSEQFTLFCKKGEHSAYIDFPLKNQSHLENFKQLLSPAYFGKGNQNIYDDKYRKALYISGENVALSQEYQKNLQYLIEDIENVLLFKYNIIKTNPSLYKLNLYETGDFFKMHKDSPKGENSISLIVSLPIKYTGGEFVIRNESDEKIINLSSDHENQIKWVAFYSDCDHEVKEITSGNRLTLTYNLEIDKKNDNKEKFVFDNTILDGLNSIILEQFKDNKIPIYVCSHDYNSGLIHKLKNDPLSALKGNDAIIYRILFQLNIKIYLMMLYDDQDQNDEGESCLKISELHDLSDSVFHLYSDFDFENLENEIGIELYKEDDIFMMNTCKKKNILSSIVYGYMGNEWDGTRYYTNVIFMCYR